MLMRGKQRSNVHVVTQLNASQRMTKRVRVSPFTEVVSPVSAVQTAEIQHTLVRGLWLAYPLRCRGY